MGRGPRQKKVKANLINRPKKKLLHRSGSRCFSYRLEERHKVTGESKFPEIDMFKEVYVWLRDELMKQLHTYSPWGSMDGESMRMWFM
ncbi:hypothetical protein C1H46_000052 [Malus baccata]|uniref:Uncharacterized protein n=1 Tax=Malus baccata TaxID=106549 RepID=A0A540NU38_MALBA|nr:hypothetical protein C1H46_000052 [Malus baccata]